MKAVWYERNGPAREVLQCGEIPAPVPGAGEVLVRVHASGVNPSDWKTRSGSRPMVAARIIPHSDGAGVIERWGQGSIRAVLESGSGSGTGSGSGPSEPQLRTLQFHQSRQSGFLMAQRLKQAHASGSRR